MDWGPDAGEVQLTGEQERGWWRVVIPPLSILGSFDWQSGAHASL